MNIVEVIDPLSRALELATAPETEATEEAVSLVLAVALPAADALALAVVLPDPVMPPVAPASEMRWAASLSVSQPMLVPCLLTRGRAKQDVPAEH